MNFILKLWFCAESLYLTLFGYLMVFSLMFITVEFMINEALFCFYND